MDWLDADHELDWLEVGCGTGALSARNLQRALPASLVAIDPSAGFVAKAAAAVPEIHASFRQGDAQSLDLPTASADVIAAALVFTFIPDRQKAWSEMRRVARPGGRVAFHAWDYPGGGVEIMRAFRTAATALDFRVRHLTRLANAIRAHLAEFGLPFRRAICRRDRV